MVVDYHHVCCDKDAVQQFPNDRNGWVTVGRIVLDDNLFYNKLANDLHSNLYIYAVMNNTLNQMKNGFTQENTQTERFSRLWKENIEMFENRKKTWFYRSCNCYSCVQRMHWTFKEVFLTLSQLTHVLNSFATLCWKQQFKYYVSSSFRWLTLTANHVCWCKSWKKSMYRLTYWLGSSRDFINPLLTISTLLTWETTNNKAIRFSQFDQRLAPLFMLLSVRFTCFILPKRCLMKYTNSLELVTSVYCLNG